MKATLHIDEVKYNAKPNGRQVMNRIKKGDNVVDAEPTQLLEAVTSGQTVVLGKFSPAPFVEDGKLIQQSYFMLDFDNKDENGERFQDERYTSYDSMVNDSFIKENALFIYTTFSHTEGHDRFRIAFKSNKPMTTEEEVKNLYAWLFSKYPTADVKAGSARRLFYGGKGTHTIFNLENTLPEAETVVEAPKASKKRTTSKKVESVVVKKKPVKKLPTLLREDGTLPTVINNSMVEMIQNGEISAIREHLNVERTVFPTIFVAIEHLIRLPLSSILGLQDDTNLYDIFHSEKTPSARIYKDKNGIERYHCFSESSEFDSLNIVELVQYVKQVQYHEAVMFLMAMFDIEIKVEEDVQRIYNQLDMFIHVLSDVEVLDKHYKDLKKFIGRSRPTAIGILELIRRNTFIDRTTGKQRVAIIFSLDTIASKIGRGRDSVENTINKLKFLEVIKSVPDNEIPANLLEDMNKNKERHQLNRSENYKARRTNMLEVKLDDNILSKANDTAMFANENRFNAESLKERAVGATVSVEKHNEMFVQDKKDVALTKERKKIVDSMVKATQRLLNKHGYVNDEMMGNALKQAYKRSKKWADEQVRAFRSVVLEQLDLTAIANNKDTRKEHNLPSTLKGRKVYIKEVA